MCYANRSKNKQITATESNVSVGILRYWIFTEHQKYYVTGLLRNTRNITLLDYYGTPEILRYWIIMEHQKYYVTGLLRNTRNITLLDYYGTPEIICRELISSSVFLPLS